MPSINFADDDHNRYGVRPLLLIAIAIGVSSLLGLILGIAMLRDFGNGGHSGAPLAVLGYAALAGIMTIPVAAKPRLVASLLAIPIVLTVVTVIRILLDLASGTNAGAAPANARAEIFILPNAATIGVLALLTLAVAITHTQPHRFKRTAAALASTALGISLVSAIFVLFGTPPAPAASNFHMPPLAAMAQAIAIAIAMLLLGGWPNKFIAIDPAHANAMRIAFPIFIIVPAFSALIEVFVHRSGVLPEMAVDIGVAGINVAVFASLVFWSISRVADEHAAQREIANAMDAAPIVLTSLAGNVLYWSRGCEELYGWTAAEAIGRCKYEILHSKDAATRQPVRFAAGIRDLEHELIERRRDGTTVAVIERVRLVEAEGRAPIKSYTMTDITARVRADAALKESESRFLAVLEARQIGTFEWSAATDTIAVSPGLEQRFGLQTGDLRTVAEWIAMIDSDDVGAVLDVINEARREQKERFSFSYRMTVPNGGTRVIEGSGRMFFDNEGDLTTMVGVVVDVTDRNEREAALLAEREQFQLVLRTVPSAMVIFDDQEVIKAYSASAERMFGYTAEEAIGQKVEILAASPSIHKADSFIDRYLKGGTSYVSNGTPVTYAGRRDRSLVPIELWMGDMWVGEKRLFVSFCKDLSEQLASEERLSEMRDELAHVSRLSAMGEMAAGLAHELNQPLAAAVYFLGAADLVLADSNNIEQGRSLLRLASEQTLRAGEIIRRMRGFTMREGIDMQVGPVDGIIEDAVALAFLGAHRFDIDIVYDLDPKAKAVMCDRIQIGQVLINLLRNATEELRKCPPNGRRILIATELLDPDTIELSVADSGPGFDLENLDQLFMPFITTKPKNGMGVGLSICRRIIEAHGGTFDVSNQPGGGAIFKFTLSSISNEALGAPA